MNVEILEELLNELSASLESLEAQHAALLQLLKDEGTVSDDKFGPYLTAASKASNVRWRAARIRLGSLLSAEKQKEEQLAEKDRPSGGSAPDPAPTPAEATTSKNDSAGSEDVSQGVAIPDSRVLAAGADAHSAADEQ